MKNETQDAIGAVEQNEIALDRLAQIAAELGSERLAGEAQSIAERVKEGRFYVACIGQFKRGKSTLINALIGEAILPTGITPVTAVPTVVRYGRRHSARIRASDQEWTSIPFERLEEYVSEERNPENAKHIEAVEVFVPSAILASGMCFVDTPGLGSVFGDNTAATKAFIPHIDAALVIIGADPPIGGDELALVEAVTRHVRDFIVVINKTDRVSECEREVASGFARKLLAERTGRDFDVLAVSAVERLQENGRGRDWLKLIAALQTLVDESGSQLVRRSGERGIRRISEQMLAILEEERAALVRPIEESEQRILTLRGMVADAERSMSDLAYLFTAEQHRLSDLFLSRRKSFLAEVLPLARDELRAAMQSLPRCFGPRYRRQVLNQAQGVAKLHVLPGLKNEEAFGEQTCREAAARFVDIANDFLRRTAEAGISELSRMPHGLSAERGFRTRSQFHFYDFITVAQPASVLRWAADALLSAVGAFGYFRRDAGAFLERLLESNSSRVQSDINQRALEGRHHLEADICILLREISYAAEQALRHARATFESGAGPVQTQLSHFEKVSGELLQLAEVMTKVM